MSSAANSRSVPNGAVCAADPDLAALGPVARGEMPLLVELAVVRQVDLRHDAEQPAAVDRHARSCRSAAAMAQRRADQQQRQQLRRAFGDACSTPLPPRPAAGPEAAGRRSRSRTAPVRGRPPAPRIARRRSRATRRIGFGIGGGVGDAAPRGAGGDPREAVTIDGAERHGIFRNSGRGHFETTTV